MMKKEFEVLTGIFPSDELYKAIEAAYYDFAGDKTAFCKAYKANKDGIAERIQREGYSAELAERRLRENFKRRGKKRATAET